MNDYELIEFTTLILFSLQEVTAYDIMTYLKHMITYNKNLKLTYARKYD